MTEFLLNGIWLAVAAATMLIVPRRSPRAAVALGCVLALLFPIISASDDFSADRETLERATIAIVSTLLLAFAALGRSAVRLLGFAASPARRRRDKREIEAARHRKGVRS